MKNRMGQFIDGVIEELVAAKGDRRAHVPDIEVRLRRAAHRELLVICQRLPEELQTFATLLLAGSLSRRKLVDFLQVNPKRASQHQEKVCERFFDLLTGDAPVARATPKRQQVRRRSVKRRRVRRR